MSLRQELYDDVPALYEDAQKYRDLLKTITWTEDSLLTLIARRIRHCAVQAGHNPSALAEAHDIACWNAVFAPPPGHPSDGSFRYMVGRTLQRPREIIQFCGETVEKARERALTLPLPYAAWAGLSAPTPRNERRTSRPSTGFSTPACSASSMPAGGGRRR